MKNLAGQGDLGDAERHGQTNADADRATAVAVGCKLVEYPSTRWPVGISDKGEATGKTNTR